MNPLRIPLAILATALLLAAPALAQDTGDQVSRQGRIGENYYAAGGTLRLKIQVTGDVVAAGGDVDLDGETSGNVLLAGGQVRVQQVMKGDLMAAAGSLEVRGRLLDDARIVGGEVNVFARVGGDLIAAGGRVTLAPGALVEGHAALAGGRVEVNGTVNKRLHAAGRTVVINGVVNGDTQVDAQHIILGPTARLNGAFAYRSPAEAQIDPAAKLAGKVTREPMPLQAGWSKARFVFRIVFATLLALTVFLAGAAWLALFPGFSRSAPATLRASPWRSLLIGAVIAVAAPLVLLALTVIVIGIPLAVLLWLLFPALAVLGLATSTLFLGDWAQARLKRSGGTGARLLGLLLVAVLLLVLLQVPYLGGLILLAALLFGSGAFVLGLWRTDGGR